VLKAFFRVHVRQYGPNQASIAFSEEIAFQDADRDRNRNRHGFCYAPHRPFAAPSAADLNSGSRAYKSGMIASNRKSRDLIEEPHHGEYFASKLFRILDNRRL
jgi:hypothetical protein